MDQARLPADLDDAAYLDAIESLSFEDVTWDRESIIAVRDLFGHWDHNIALGHGVFTSRCEERFPAHQEIMDVVNQELAGNFDGKRVLDIGCLEGYFAAECALHGAEVVGVEGKLINVRKCEFVKSVLGIERFRIVQDDAIAVTHDRYGTFDVVLALGLLYHLDDPFTFLEQVAELCEGFALIDTHVALEQLPEAIGEGWTPELSARRRFTHRGRSYEGRLFREFEGGATQLDKDLSPTAALSNEQSVWLTEDSLAELLRDVGFDQVEKLVYGRGTGTWWSDVERDARVLLLAMKRRRPFRSRVFAEG